jgi:hypothetical protein
MGVDVERADKVTGKVPSVPDKPVGRIAFE